MQFHQNVNSNNLRVIKTARSADSINEAARNGYFPLVKKVEPSDQIRSKFAILQNKSTGEIKVIGDYRSGGGDPFGQQHEVIIDFTFHYPHVSTCPFAAYLVPEDIEPGEEVFLEDLIEDFVGATWNQGDSFRLAGCNAIWNGKEFGIQYTPQKRMDFIG